MNSQTAMSLELFIKRARGNQDLAFTNYVKACLLTKKPLIIPSSFNLKLNIGKIPVNGHLTLKGGGTILGNKANNLFRVEDGAKITLEDIKFEGFKSIFKCGKRDINFSLTADSIYLNNCRGLIFSGINNQQRKKVGPILVQNSMFKNCIGPVIEIRNLNLDNVQIKNNHFINERNLKNDSAVIEIGSGSNSSTAKNIEISNNVIDNFNFVELGCGIIVHGATQVNISKNKISNIRCLSEKKQSYGIYIKASHARILQNDLHNAGDGEAAIINKGLAKNHSLTTPGTISGDHVLIAENKIHYTDHYHKKTQKAITGITVTGSNQIVRDNVIGNVTNGIELRSGPIKAGVKYLGGFQITGNWIKKLQHQVNGNKASVVRGISIMQASRNILIENNTIIFTKKILVNPKFIYGITALTNADTKDIVIKNNAIKNKIAFKDSKTSFAINFRTKGLVEGLAIKQNKIDSFSFGVVLNDNNNQSVFKNVDVENDYSNIKKKQLRMMMKNPNLHSIRLKDE